MLSPQARIAVQCTQLSRAFGARAGRFWALQCIDLVIHCGELCLLVGPSGCGKTTLLSVIAGILEATCGEVAVFGERFSTMSVRERTRFRAQTVGIAFQQLHLLPMFTASENAAVPLIINGVPRRKAVQIARELLTQLGMAKLTESFPSELSSGQQQRTAVARALIHQPRLLMCDEPTSSLDSKAARQLMLTLRAVSRSVDRAVLVVTHDQRLLEFADRVIRMDDGKIVTQGASDEWQL